jgi:hypothetical protein
VTRRLIATLAAALLASSASARVGETEQQIEMRYGKPIFPLSGSWSTLEDELGGELRTYLFHEFTIVVTFVDGKSEVELFKKCKQDIPCDKEWATMSEAEVAAILAGYESVGVKWKPEEGVKRPMWWTSSDGRLKAINMFNQLQIGTADYIEERTAKIKQNEADRLKGF